MKGALQATRALASLGLDLAMSEELRAAARADLERRVGGRPYVSPLDPELRHPLETPAFLQDRFIARGEKRPRCAGTAAPAILGREAARRRLRDGN
jgi:hypothetical protein